MPESKCIIKLNNGINIPQLGFGTWQITGKECENAVKWALEAGYRHIDTAKIYGNEAEAGKSIKNFGIKREEIFITTKLWNSDHDNVERAFEASLRNLGVPYIDLYLMHYPVPERNQSWKSMEKLLKSGKCKSIGVSNFTIRHLNSLIGKSDIIPAVNQVEFTPLLYQKELLDFCAKNKIIVESYSPLTHGQKLNDPRFTRISSKYKKSNAKLLIKWCLQHGLVAIPKSRRKEKILENFDVFDFEISKEDMKFLDSMNEDLRFCWDPTNAP